MTTTPAPTDLFDPFAPGFTDDPYPTYTRVRSAAPVLQHEVGFWLLTRYDDVSELLRSGLSVDEGRLAPGPFLDVQAMVYGDRRIRLGGLSMLDLDPPDHTRLRALVSKAFTPRAIAALEPHIVELVDAALDRLAAERTADLVDTLAFPLPFQVISEMMGMPETEHELLRERSGLLVRSLEPVVDPEIAAGIVRADDELSAMARDVITWKRSNPGEDLLTALIAAEDDGDVLSDDELVAQVVLLYVAGHETTVNLISNGVLGLLRAPDQLALLRSQPDLAPNAVEEMLRFDSPVQMTRRVTLAPYRIGEVEIPEGAFVIASLGAANRDPEHWGEDAEQLRLDRPDARQHLSFGAGHHHCLGAALARLEGRVAVSRLVQRFTTLEMAGDVEWNGRINLRGPERLPVRAA
jgi:cytochrome P450